MKESLKEMKSILFKTYQWPPSCIPNDKNKIERILKKMRKLHPDTENKGK